MTVVVPVHNVEQYLEDCLASIAAQTLTALDVVMVDDGSTDGGPALAERWARRDPRFRLVRQANGGLGHARNTGVRHADPGTAYLAFVDSDDVLPPRAYESLTGLLEESGSDFATGNVYRLDRRGRVQAWQQRGMTRTVTRTHITRDLGLLSDRVAWNKVFRRSFWDRHALAFPEGVLYEDTPLTIPAHFLAEAVDVLHEHVYYWRLREGSITRRRGDVTGVRDRIAGVDRVSRFLARSFPAHKRDYDRSVLADDLLYFMEALPMAGSEYRKVFMAGARDWLARVDPSLPGTLPVELRMRWELVRAGRLADLLVLLEHERAGGRGVFDLGGPPVPFLRRRAVLPRPDGSPVPLPRSASAVAARDLPVTARLREVAWRDGKLLLKGYAYIRNVDARTRRSSLKAAVAVCGRRRVLLPVRTVAAPEVTDESGQERHCYDWSGFEITLDPRRLRRGGAFRPGQWRIGVVVAAGTLVRAAALRPAAVAPPRPPGPPPSYPPPPAHPSNPSYPYFPSFSYSSYFPSFSYSSYFSDSSSAPHPAYPAFALDGTTRLVPWVHDGRLQLSVEPVRRRLVGHRALPGGQVELELEVRDRRPPVAVRLRERGGAVLDCPLDVRHAPEAAGKDDGWTRATAAVDPGDLARGRPPADGLPREVAPETTAAWSAEVLFADGGTARIAVDARLAPGRHPLPPGPGGLPRELTLGAGPTAGLLLHDAPPCAFADALTRADDGRLRLEGELPAGTRTGGPYGGPDAGPGTGPGAARLLLRHATYAAEYAVPLTAEGTRFRADLDPAGLPHPGHWYPWVRVGGLQAPVRMAPGTPAALPPGPGPGPGGGRPLRVERHVHDLPAIVAGDFVPAADRGPYRQRLLRERRYPVLRKRAPRPAVVYSDFDGRGVGDSPRAVHEELVRRGAAVEHLWVVTDPAAPVPPAARAVVRGSHAWYEALARSRYVVTNTHLPAWFERRPGQRVVQTWHGTPIKRIGLDLEGTLCADLPHMWPQPRRGDQWSVLLSPNTPSTPVLRRALHHHGEIAETGLPRTDLLAAEDRDKVAEEVRARLGLPADRTVVLYAPTVRDDEAYDAGHHRLHLPLDLAALERELSGSHVLLVRAHPLVADTVPADGRFVRDVSAHPDLAELLLAADVLVTDYSAVMADFAVTGRPILLHTPDLARYRDQLRGFTLDYEERAPGPLLSSADELIGALRDPVAAVRPREAAYAAFRAAFCHLDDGRAAARVADLLLC
ncbi:CDP-glycerol glycerophosphotransferase family protein [Streptomyces sp. HPF1205]|uniref:CDP-glycerol glycerophosphotransferase family protein n=1 Tax=Streptomyces sp. HPF1205 TaxID=2873262 RepID=UPI0027E168C0|nr:CDP-glycerol glycerophosphotransferase family protein [Streptomyces sp. HPF1205]